MYRWHAFSYEWFDTKTRFARGKSQLFIHELLREPLISNVGHLSRFNRSSYDISVHLLSCSIQRVMPDKVLLFSNVGHLSRFNRSSYICISFAVVPCANLEARLWTFSRVAMVVPVQRDYPLF